MQAEVTALIKESHWGFLNTAKSSQGMINLWLLLTVPTAKEFVFQCYGYKLDYGKSVSDELLCSDRFIHYVDDAKQQDTFVKADSHAWGVIPHCCLLNCKRSASVLCRHG